ncbi:MAG TPA: bifunctional diguanylate cyclase/phosphodiesterase [bacterium]|nr:bifunctional diguanylate cyclase/phosphodiesterase [bacterium]
MTVFRKNSWLMFYLIVLSSVLLLISISMYRWNDIKQFYNLSQKELATHWYGSFSSILEQQEAIITIIGDSLTKFDKTDSDQIQTKLDSLMNINPGFFSGFALISPHGEVLELTSNLTKNNVTNILVAPQVRDSFNYTLQVDKMVLGRTYNAPRLVIPARKAIRNENGTVVAVMTGALKISEDEGFFSHARVLGDFNQISIIRNRDHFIQYAYDGEITDNFHEAGLPYDRLIADIKENYDHNFPVSSSNNIQIPFNIDTDTARGNVSGVAMYNPRYEFWLVSEIQNSHLLKEFLESFIIYLIISISFVTGMFFLFRYLDRVERKRREELMFQASHDSLTQLPNRNYLLSAFSEWRVEKTHFSLMFIDLDNFKGINDNFSHSVGDMLLVELSTLLRADLAKDDLLVRHGGDEFILLTSDSNQKEKEQKTADIIYKACENISVLDMTFSPGCSIGIARYPEHGTDLDDLLLASDIAMYQAKKKSNTLEVYNPALEQDYLYRLRLEHLLDAAVDKGEIFMLYQPQVDSEGALIGVEALARWKHPKLGFIPPDQFINIAEQSGHMIKLGEFIIDNCLRQYERAYKQFKTAFSLSINISIRQFAEKDFVGRLINRIRDVNIPPHLICIEITENLLIDDMDNMRSNLQRLHNEGIRISLDDFGTGYSSLSILRDLPIDELKIDKSFIDKVTKDETSLKMVENIIGIGRLYGMSIVAEGAEIEEQIAILKNCGCDCFQGYYFSEPITFDDLAKKYTSLCRGNYKSID